MHTEISHEEFKNFGANALPLQNIGVDGNRNFDHALKNHRRGAALPPPFTIPMVIPTGSTGDYLAAGIWGQYIYINPQKNVVIVKTSTGSWTMTTKDDDEAVAMFRAISQKLE